MSLTTAFILILFFTFFYALLIEIFSVLFRLTGLTKVKSRFQAISLLTNCGFTTSESEVITNHRARRNIAIASMITGYVYSVIIVSLLINFLNNVSTNSLENNYVTILISFLIFIVLFIIIKLPFIKKYLERFIEHLAKILVKREKIKNVLTLLDVYGKDAIVEIFINSIPEIIKDKPLSEINFREMYKLNILLLKRRGKIVEITKDTIFQNGDTIVVFGSNQNIKDLFETNVKDIELLDIEDKINENVIKLIDNYGADAMAEILINNVPSELKDTSLIESGLKEKFLINILMLKRNDKMVYVNKNTIIEKNDELIVFGPYKNIKEIFFNFIDNL